MMCDVCRCYKIVSKMATSPVTTVVDDADEGDVADGLLCVESVC